MCIMLHAPELFTCLDQKEAFYRHTQKPIDSARFSRLCDRLSFVCEQGEMFAFFYFCVISLSQLGLLNDANCAIINSVEKYLLLFCRALVDIMHIMCRRRGPSRVAGFL